MLCRLREAWGMDQLAEPGIHLKSEVRLLVHHIPEFLIFYPGPQLPTPLVIWSSTGWSAISGGVSVTHTGVICHVSSLFAGLVTIDSPRRPSMDVTIHHACDPVLA